MEISKSEIKIDSVTFTINSNEPAWHFLRSIMSDNVSIPELMVNLGQIEEEEIDACANFMEKIYRAM